jgi:hypothetical protein
MSIFLFPKHIVLQTIFAKHKTNFSQLLILLLLVFSSSVAMCQIGRIKELAIQENKFTGTYKVDDRAYASLQLSMAYGNTTISNAKDLNKIEEKMIRRIDLVYSSFPVQGYNDLTEKRLLSLYKIAPSLFERKDITWNLVVQNNCQDEEAAKSLFHGFVVYYLDPNKKLANASDLNYMKKTFADTSNSALMHMAFKDSTVLRVLSRNSAWNNMLVIADLTGSMSPYVAQLLIWYRLNTKEDLVRNWLFFNDGDFKSDEEKKIGETGGIYQVKTGDFNEVLHLTYETMLNGNGGDAAENDLEAVLKGMQACPECEDVVVIADNQAPVRDMELLSKIKKPLKIILCGSQAGINAQFLNIARQTGGSVHTIEQDITRLLEMNEGEVFKVGKQTFRVEGGKVVLVKGS